jgi:hypothetical protein
MAMVGLSLAGCATHEAFLPVATTRAANLDLSGVDVRSLPIKRRIRGEDSSISSLLFFPVGRAPSLGRAVENALARGQGNVLANVEVRSRNWWFLPVGLSTLEVEGDVVVLPEKEPAEPQPLAAPDHFWAISTEHAPMFGYQLQEFHKVESVEAEVDNHFIFWVPTRPDPARLEDAIAKALYRGNGDVLTDASVQYWSWYIPFLYGEEGWRIRGDVVRTRKY